MSAAPPPPARLYGGRIIAADETVASIDRTVAGIVFDPPGRRWWIAVAGVSALLACAALYPVSADIGIRSVDLAVVRAMDGASYDWWIGIASGSLLVSAVMLLAGAEWRCAVSRVAETVALLGVVTAALSSIVRLGRPWTFSPTPSSPDGVDLAAQFVPPPVWDAISIVSFLVVCLTVLSIGLLPDLAILRDRAREGGSARLALRRMRIYGLLAAGWRGSAAQWQRWLEAYRAVALLGALLVISLQTCASVGLAGSVLPGRHDTLLPVTVLVGAVLAGVGVTAALVVALRAIYRLDGLITERHLDILARMILVLGLASLYCHLTEAFSTLLHGDAADRAALDRSIGGEHPWALWMVICCGLLPVQIFWLPRARHSGAAIALVGLLVAFGAYADQVATLLAALPSDVPASSMQSQAVGISGVAGSIGLFLLLLLLVLRMLPIASIAQTRQLAITHNVDAASEALSAGPAEPEAADTPLWGIAAAFASEKALAAASRALLRRDRGLRLDAYGPVPMPGVFELLRRRAPRIRRYAIAGVFVGGTGVAALCLWWTLWLDPLHGGRPRVSWPSLVMPCLSAAMMTGALAVHLALLMLDRPSRLDRSVRPLPDALRSGRDRYLLTAEIRDDTEDADRIEHRLAILPEDDGRPLAIRRVAR